MFATKHIINHETKEITIYLLTLSLVWIPNTAGPYLGFFVCGGKLGFREISDQYSYKKQPSKIRHYVRKKTFSFPGGGNCPLRPPAMYGPAQYSYIFKLIGNATYQYRRLCTVYVRSSCCHVLTLPEPLCFSIQYEHKLSCLLVFLRFSQIIIFK